MTVQSLEDVGSEKKTSCHVSLEQDVHESEDQDEDGTLTLICELVHEDSQDVRINHILNAIGELGQVDQASVSVMSDLGDPVVEKSGDDGQYFAMDQSDSSLLGVGDFEDGTGGEFPDSVLLLSAAVDELHEDSSFEGFVELVSLMEIFVNFNKNLGPQYIILGLHLLDHFLYKT